MTRILDVVVVRLVASVTSESLKIWRLPQTKRVQKNTREGQAGREFGDEGQKDGQQCLSDSKKTKLDEFCGVRHSLVY